MIFGVMKTSRFNEGQIIKAIKEHEGGRKAEDIVRDLGISQGTFYKWKQKYGGMEASDVKRLKDLELENSRLKRLLADTHLNLFRLVRNTLIICHLVLNTRNT